MTRALIVVDTQVDFCEGGSLAVSGGLAVADKIRKFLYGARGYNVVTASKDWHQSGNTNGGHFSDTPDYVDTWPVHCVQWTKGAELAKPLTDSMFDFIILKGAGVPAYSPFEGSDSIFGLPLDDRLKYANIKSIDFCGLATGHCVKAGVLGGLDRGYEVRVLSDLTAAVGDQQRALDEMAAAGAVIL